MPQISTYMMKEIHGVTSSDPETMTAYGKLLLAIAGSDGEVSQGEWDCFEGIGRATGVSDEMVNVMKKWDFRSAKIEELAAPVRKAGFGRAVLYHAVKISRADGTYAKAEKDAAARAAKLLGVDDNTLKLIEQINEAEDAIREMRHAVLYPVPPTHV